MSRAVSTVLDVALFLLLIGGAVALLHAGPDPAEQPDGDVAPAVSTTLATTTTSVEYAPVGDDADVRTDRGSVATLLARATLANATAGDARLAPSGEYERAVENETRRALRGVDGAGVRVRAVWEPLPGADLGGETVVGPAPPPQADVHAATTSVALGTARDAGVAAPHWHGDGQRGDGFGPRSEPVPSVGGAAAPPRRSLRQVAAVEGCSGLADAIARRVVGAYFPPERTATALRGEGAATARSRYRTFADAVGVDRDAVPLERDARRTNALLVAALADDLEPAACRGYDDPATAAREAAPDDVTLVVRTWSP